MKHALSIAALDREKMETLHPATIAVRRMLFDAHNLASVAKLEHAVCETDTPTFGGKYGDDGPNARY
jgi:hypothetical protein